METEDRRSDHEREDAVYKTKIVEFLGRSTPIVLQNDNGPCPLIAICNVLLLRNNLNLTPETTEVSLQRLLSVIAEKLIDCNCNVEDKDDGYVSNQQQNIADAIDLLPRLATGIDVNVQFKKINDFEFTRECAIFDLLDIGLYHGWIVDPQDTDTAAAIGTKSYNTLVGELVAFETRKTEGEDKNIPGDDDVDFVAATTATLGVPSPSLSSGRSFDDCPATIPVEQVQRRGDIEEVMELMRALDNSKAETSSTVNASLSPDADFINSSLFSERIIDIKNSRSVVEQIGYQSEKPHPSNSVAHQESSESNDFKDDGLHSKDLLPENGYILPSVTEPLICNDIVENVRTDTACETTVGDVLHGFNKDEAPTNAAEEDQAVVQSCNVDFSIAQIHQEPIHNLIDYDPTVSSVIDAASCESFHLSNGREELPDTLEVITSSLENTEPIYEGEECIHGSGLPLYEEREPVYEGETLLAEQTNKIQDDSCSVDSGHNIQRQWQSIKNFLQNSASQLTIYGLFCLQEGLKERELCVFFRNNHFNTMFKFNGQLYLLATDQGYITQPDLVWEKLNEVNGDTVFMTGNFKEFKVENQVSDSWNEQSAMTSTADYLAALEVSSPSSSAMNSDLQLAISLQQQEFEQQQPPQRHQQQQQQQQNQQTQPHHNYNQSPLSLGGRSRLFTGPQGSRNPSASSQKNDSKSKESKDKCAMM